MSISIAQIVGERSQEIMDAVEERDAEKLYRLASLESKDGNDESAQTLMDTIKQWNKEDWSYDEANNN